MRKPKDSLWRFFSSLIFEENKVSFDRASFRNSISRDATIFLFFLFFLFFFSLSVRRVRNVEIGFCSDVRESFLSHRCSIGSFCSSGSGSSVTRRESRDSAKVG